jgi:hypothetical protein
MLQVREMHGEHELSFTLVINTHAYLRNDE